MNRLPIHALPEHAILYGGSARRAIAVLCGAFFLLFLSMGLRADEYTEEEVKAAFVLNFAKFVEWPDPKEETLPAAQRGTPP